MRLKTIFVASLISLLLGSLLILLWPKTEKPKPPEVDQDNVGEIVKFEGVIESVFTDCVELKKLNEKGEIETTPAMSCDGGSYITVSGKHINTASGFVPPEMSFNKHDPSLDPGDKVAVVAIVESHGLTLDCDECGINKFYNFRSP